MANPAAPVRPVLVFVLGMHRSGTSLASRMVAAAGFEVPGKRLAANADNPEGYFEPSALVRANNRMLAELGRPWFDDRPVPALQRQRVDERWAPRTRRLLRLWLRRYPRLLLKDPRLCVNFAVWRDAALACGADVRVLLVQRRAYEVADSLARRYATPAFRPASIRQQARSDLLWLKHVLMAEQASRALPRALLNYEQLVNGQYQALQHLLTPYLDTLPALSLRPPAVINGRQNLSVLRRVAHADVHTAQGRQVLQLASEAQQAVQTRFSALRTQPVAPPPQHDPLADRVLSAIDDRFVAGSMSLKHVVFVSTSVQSRGHIYRVHHTMQGLQARGVQVHLASQPDSQVVSRTTDAVVLFRLRWTRELAAFVEHCRACGVALIYDIDDAIFVPELMTPEHFDYVRIKPHLASEWAAAAPQYQQVLRACDAALVTTQALATLAQRYQPRVYVVPNGLDQDRLHCDQHRPALQRVVLGYASGTPTHQKDFAELAGAVAAVLERYPQAQLCVVGHLDVDEFPVLAAYRARVEQRPLVDFAQLPAELARFDINLAPLQADNPFCAAKSELKYFEAAAVRVVTVASDTPPMRQAITSGYNGYIAQTPEQWTEMLSELVENPVLRERVADTARQHAVACYGPEARTDRFMSQLSRILMEHQNRFS